MAAFGQVAFQRSEVPPNAELVDETGHDATRQLVRGLRFSLLLRARLFLLCSLCRKPLRHAKDLIEGLLDLPRGLRVDAVAAAGFNAETVLLRKLMRAH